MSPARIARGQGLGRQSCPPSPQDKEEVSELEAVMEKQKKKVEGKMETEII